MVVQVDMTWLGIKTFPTIYKASILHLDDEFSGLNLHQVQSNFFGSIMVRKLALNKITLSRMKMFLVQIYKFPTKLLWQILPF